MSPEWMNRPLVDAAARWLLGAVFISAALPKIVSPAAFAKIVYGYGLVPPMWINAIAIGLPFVELIAALALIAGVFVQSAARVLTGLLVLFIGAICINWIRGHAFDCGCFSVTGQATSAAPAMILARDLALLVGTVYVDRFAGQRRWTVTGNRSGAAGPETPAHHPSDGGEHGLGD